MDVALGQQIGGGRFDVLARIGEGGAGVVYEVKDRQSDSRLALKTVRGAGPEELASLKREFRAVQDLSHPNLVRLDELFEEDGTWFFTMELVDGKDWLSYVRPEGRVDVARVRATLVQIVEALAALHARGMVHRDVKPGNVLVAPDGHVKVLDFGITSARDRIASAAAEGIVGTMTYMAPEQLLAEEPGPAADFYALGAMLHLALVGKRTHFDRPGHAAEEKVKGAPTAVGEVAPHAPEDLAALCDALLRSAPEERPQADAILRALGTGSASPSEELHAASEAFVGRTSELESLWEAFRAVTAGRTVAVLVEGASGVGKSALVRHFLGEVKERALVLQGRCHEREYVPYKGIDALVDELAVSLGEDSDAILLSLTNPAMRLLPRLFPVLKRVPYFARLASSSYTLPEGDASELRARIFGAFRELVSRVAALRPLVLSIDDVQWADGDSWALLGDLLAPPSPPPLLLVCTRRLVEDAEGGAGASAPLRLPGDLRTVRVGGLSEEEMASLASRLAHETSLEPAELRTLARESGGHPLFLQELMRRRARGTGGDPSLRLDDALWDRILHLEPAERRLVETCAVAGAPTSLDLIASAAGLSKQGIAEHMARLRGANLVKISGQAADRKIEPYHDRVREAVVRNLDIDARRACHERLARVLDASRERDVERLALHWEGAGDVARAASLYREAGDRASQGFAFDRAVDLYRRSLALGGRSPADQVERAIADALFNAGRGLESGNAFLALAGNGEDRPALELRLRAAKAFFGSGYVNEGLAAIRTCLLAVDLSLPDGRFAVVFRVLWYRLLVRLQGFRFAPRDLATVPPRDLLRFDVCTEAAFGIGMADTVRGSIFQYRALRLGLALGDPKRAMRALCGAALSTCTGGVATAKMTADAIARARELAAVHSDPYADALILGASGFGAYMLEEWSQAEVFLRDAEARFRDLRGASFELGTSRMMHGRTLAQLGRFDLLAIYQGPSLRDAIRRNDVFAVVNTRATVSALVALVRDDVAEAETEIAEATRLIAAYRFQMQHFYCVTAGCQIDLYRGDPAAMLARLERHRSELRASLFERVQSIRVGLTSLRARAHLALAARGGEGTGEHVAFVERCVRTLRHEGLPGARAMSFQYEATLAAIAGDVPAAVRALRTALAGFDDRAMALHAAAARYRLARLVGGEEGATLDRACREALAGQRVVAPEKYLEHYAPGFHP